MNGFNSSIKKIRTHSVHQRHIENKVNQKAKTKDMGKHMWANERIGTEGCNSGK